eukprot:gene5528-5762_t
MDLSEDLMAQIQADVAEAWYVMERATNERAGRLISSLNGAIHRLSARLEGAVSDALEIRLEAVSLRLAAPDACQFHADLSDLIDKGISQQQARHVRSCERTDLVWEARGRGVCRLTQYYVQVPRRRRIIETYTATTYNLLPSAVADHFMAVVENAISATEAQLAGYVREYVRRQVEAARHKVQEYGDRYIEGLTAALETSSQGAAARSAALSKVDDYCRTLEDLRVRLAALQERAELMVPHNSGAGCGAFEQLDFEDEEYGTAAEGQQPGELVLDAEVPQESRVPDETLKGSEGAFGGSGSGVAQIKSSMTPEVVLVVDNNTDEEGEPLKLGDAAAGPSGPLVIPVLPDQEEGELASGAAPAAAASAAMPSNAQVPPGLLDANAIEGAQVLGQPGGLTHGGGSSGSGSITPVSATSHLDSPVSIISASGTDCTAFSGMTANTGFTLESSGTLGSGFSRAQEQLANSVLIIAATEEHQSGPDGSSSSGVSSLFETNQEFRESFAAALTAAGLDQPSGPEPPSGSQTEGSEDWQLVDAEEEQAEVSMPAATK